MWRFISRGSLESTQTSQVEVIDGRSTGDLVSALLILWTSNDILLSSFLSPWFKIISGDDDVIVRSTMREATLNLNATRINDKEASSADFKALCLESRRSENCSRSRKPAAYVFVPIRDITDADVRTSLLLSHFSLVLRRIGVSETDWSSMRLATQILRISQRVTMLLPFSEIIYSSSLFTFVETAWCN